MRQIESMKWHCDRNFFTDKTFKKKKKKEREEEVTFLLNLYSILFKSNRGALNIHLHVTRTSLSSTIIIVYPRLGLLPGPLTHIFWTLLIILISN